MRTATRMMLRRFAHAVEGVARRRYVAGSTLADARDRALALDGRGYRVTLGYWNDLGEAPHRVLRAYRHTLEQAADAGVDARLAVKVPAIGYEHEHFAGLVAASRRARVPLHLDSMRPDEADRILGCIEHFPDASIGCTLPARWRRSAADADWAAARGLTVRVVKGQWSDGHDGDVRRSYLDLIERLAGGAERVLVATHDIPLACAALDRLRQRGTPCELEVLQGLPVRRLLPRIFERNLPVRVYLPYGRAWLPYCLSTVRRDPKVLWWLAKDSMSAWGRPRFPPRPAV